MNNAIYYSSIIAVIAPLMGSMIAGLAGKKIGKSGAHWVTIIGVAIAVICSAYLFKLTVIDGIPAANFTVYTWASGGSFNFNVGFLIDRLSTIMMLTVTIVSLIVHIYSIGYMHDDPGYQRFFHDVNFDGC